MKSTRIDGTNFLIPSPLSDPACGHDDVGQEQIDGAFERSGEFEGLSAARLSARCTVSREYSSRHFAQTFFVVDYQDGLGTHGRRDLFKGFVFANGGLVRVNGQEDGNGRTNPSSE